MEAYFSNLFEDIRYERSLVLLLSSTDLLTTDQKTKQIY